MFGYPDRDRHRSVAGADVDRSARSDLCKLLAGLEDGIAAARAPYCSLFFPPLWSRTWILPIFRQRELTSVCVSHVLITCDHIRSVYINFTTFAHVSSPPGTSATETHDKPTLHIPDSSRTLACYYHFDRETTSKI